jgi:hypothetical protein
VIVIFIHVPSFSHLPWPDLGGKSNCKIPTKPIWWPPFFFNQYGSTLPRFRYHFLAIHGPSPRQPASLLELIALDVSLAQLWRANVRTNGPKCGDVLKNEVLRSNYSNCIIVNNPKMEINNFQAISAIPI